MMGAVLTLGITTLILFVAWVIFDYQFIFGVAGDFLDDVKNLIKKKN